MRRWLILCLVTVLIDVGNAGAVVRSAAEKDLVLWYTFDEGTGGVVKDSSGHGNHGKIHGAEFVKVADGHAMRFDGVDDYIDCGKSEWLDVRTAFSVEFWILEEVGVPTGQPRVMGKSFSSYLVTRRYRGICCYKGGRSHNVRGPGIPDKTTHRVRPNGHRSKEYPPESLMINTYRTISRAQASTATLTISDWRSEDEPGGAIGQRIMVNFVQVQPYLEE